jgi:hypothetical protein
MIRSARVVRRTWTVPIVCDLQPLRVSVMVLKRPISEVVDSRIADVADRLAPLGEADRSVIDAIAD